MHVLESSLQKKPYLKKLKGCLTSPLDILNERMTGVVIASFFSIAYYNPHGWNGHLSGECNRAWGWVKEVDGKTAVYFIRGKGLFSPFWLITFTLLFVLGLTAVVLTETGGLLTIADDMGVIWLFGVITAIVICGVTAMHSSVAKEGIAGAGEITRVLQDPSIYYCQ